MNNAPDWARSLWDLLAIIGVNPKEVKSPLISEGFRATVGDERTKTAICFDGDDPEELREAGWHVINLALPDMAPFHRVFSAVMELRVERKRSVLTTPKQTSQAEEMLLREILKRQIPAPERDFSPRREDGTELTTPDFAWQREKLAFYVDGGYWHHGKDVQEILESVAAEGKGASREISKKVTTRREKDEDNRRALAAQGWSVMGCSAEKIVDDPEYLARTADDIATAWKIANENANAREKFAGTGQDALDLLG